MSNSIQENLIEIRKLLLENKDQEAKDLLLSLHIVDTPQHLALPNVERHLIWDLYEYLVADNLVKLEKKEIIAELNDLS